MQRLRCRKSLVLGLVLAAGFFDGRSLMPSSAGQDLEPKLPDLRLSPRPPLTHQQIERIKHLISRFAELENVDPDFALSFPRISFSPLPGFGKYGLWSGNEASSETIREVVAFGPDALPFLLDALDDKTPTRIVFEHGDDLNGAMWHGEEFLFVGSRLPWYGHGKDIESYAVTVGDVCFVTIGQIVGEPYQVRFYQPTGCAVLYSPVQNPNLCATVREHWRSDDPRGKLLNSLIASLALEYRPFMARQNDRHYRQAGAALRLLYYFPEETKQFLVEQLDLLYSRQASDPNKASSHALIPRDSATMVINALVWSKDPLIRAAIARVPDRSDDEFVLLASLPAFDDPQDIRRRLESRIKKLGPDDATLIATGRHLLEALLKWVPESAKPTLDRYLSQRTINRCHKVCMVLRDAVPSWAPDLLVPMLDDGRLVTRPFPMNPMSHDQGPHPRVCDWAALALSAHCPDLPFTPSGDYASRDQQIEAFRARFGQAK